MSRMRLLKILVIVVVVLAILWIICSEADRKAPERKVIPSFDMYYKRAAWLTSPINLYIRNHLKYRGDKMPYPDIKTNFPKHYILQNNWEKIRDEVLELYNREGMKKIKGDLFFTDIPDDNWKRFYIKWYNESSEESKCKLPFTTSLIDSIPEIKIAMISVLEPGAVIVPHLGFFKGCLRYHLGLSTPKSENCKIKVDGIPYQWMDGEDVLFDDTFVHEVRNDTDKPRFILFCDIRRDLDSNSSNRFLDRAIRVAKLTANKN